MEAKEEPQRIKLMLDPTEYHSKPPENMRWKVSKDIAASPAEPTVEELAQAMTKRQSFCVSLLNGEGRTKKHWVSQQVFALDFDKNLPPEDFLGQCENFGIRPAFLYTSFSDSPEYRKFRAIFLMDEAVTDMWRRDIIQGMLMKMFPECDKACNDCTRIFYGGKELIHTDFDARLTFEGLTAAFMLALRIADAGQGNYARNLRDFAQAYRAVVEGDTLMKITASIVTAKPETHILLCNSDIPVTLSEPICTPRHVPGKQYKRKLDKETKQELLDKCELLRHFASASGEVYHPNEFLICTNLVQLEGGLKWFNELLDALIAAGYEKPSKPASFMSRTMSTYHPQNCFNGGCPYLHTCKRNGFNILHQLSVKKNEVRRVEEPKSRRSVEETRELLRDALLQAYGESGARITVIKVDTGVGKTEQMLNLPLQRTFVAFPTHKLKEEAYQRYLAKNGQGYMQIKRPELPPQWCQELSVTSLFPGYLVVGALVFSSAPPPEEGPNCTSIVYSAASARSGGMTYRLASHSHCS